MGPSKGLVRAAIGRVASILLLANVPSALADWTAHADLSNCPRKHYPNLSAKEGPFATKAACQAQIEQAKRGDRAVCARYSCMESSAGSGTSPSEPGHQLDGVIERAISAGASGDISGTDAAGLVAAGMIVNALMAGAAKSPEQRRQEQQRAEAERQQQAEEARQRVAAEEARQNRLLAEMQGVEDTGDLHLMTEDGSAHPEGVGASGELALMTDDDETRGIMGKRKAPAPKRNQPPATRVSQGPYTTPVSGSAPSRGSPGNGANGPPLPEPERRGPTDRESLAQGFEDGDACRQRNAGTHCGVLGGEAVGRCQRIYNEGYDAGAANQERRLRAQGATAAAADKNANRTNAPFSHAEARGACGNIFVQAYNNAFRP